MVRKTRNLGRSFLIGILTYNPRAIARYIGEVGIQSHQVIFNPSPSEETSVNVEVGGHGVRATHCYVQHQERQTKLIQCLDPRTVMAEPMNKVFILCALAKAKAIDEGVPLMAHPKITIADNVSQVEGFLLSCDRMVAVDIECNIDTHELTCIGFARKEADGSLIALTIPFERSASGRAISYWSEMEEHKIWILVSQFLAGSCDKVFQNYIFDTMILSRLGLETKGRILDTMTLAHLIQPELPKSLKHLGRLYLTCDTWKDISSWESTEQLWNYNARDVAYTLQILENQLNMVDEKKKKFFLEHQVPLHSQILAMCEHGWNIDKTALTAVRLELEPQIAELRAKLKTFANPLLVPKIEWIERKGSLKNKRDRVYYKNIREGVYEPVEIPLDIKMLKKMPFPVYEKVVDVVDFNPASVEQVKDVITAMGFKIPTYQGAETTNEMALNKLIDKHPDVEFFELLLDYRGKAKMLNTYGNVVLDPDDKLRFSMNICGTVEGRASCKQTPWGTGFNGQNVPKEFRKVSIPHNPDSVIVNVDFRQADPHMVAWMSGEEQMLKILDSGGDLHSYTASAIMGYDITTLQDYKNSKARKLGKACNNGLNYGMGINRFMETCREQGLKLTLQEATNAYNAYFALYPKIREWQTSIKDTIKKTRVLSTPFGRTRYFYGHIDYKICNDALAYIPPTTVADALNHAWLKLVERCQYECIDVSVLMQCHDSLKLEVSKSALSALIPLIHEAFKSVKFELNGQIRCFPIDLEVGPNWGDLK